jgi:hypothetical protein
MLDNTYRYLITNLYQPSGSNYNPIVAELPFTNVNFVQQLNGIGSFQGELLLSGLNNATLADAINHTVAMEKAIFVEHNTGDPNTKGLIWGGVITGREYDSESQILKIHAQEYEYYLQKRRINQFTSSSYYTTGTNAGLVYTNIDAGVILVDLINAMQTDNTSATPPKKHTNINVVPYSFTTGSLITRTYFDFELKSVYQALKDLSQGSFFDFKIIPQYDYNNNIVLSLRVGAPAVPNSDFNRVYDPATKNHSFVFQFPGNLVSYKYVEDGTRVANYGWGLGYGANNNKIIVPKYDSSKVASGQVWPLLEDTLSFIDVKNSTLLSGMTSGILSGISYPPTTVQVVLPPWVDPALGPYGVSYVYSIGDQVRLVIKDDLYPTGLDSTAYRITEIEVSPGSNGADRVYITLMLPYASIS